MKFPGEVLGQRIYEALQGNIFLGSTEINVKEEPCEEKAPIIVIRALTDTDDTQHKSARAHDITQLFDVQGESTTQADTLTSQLLQILANDNSLDLSPDFNLWSVTLISANRIVEDSMAGSTIRNLIRLRFRISET